MSGFRGLERQAAMERVLKNGVEAKGRFCQIFRGICQIFPRKLWTLVIRRGIVELNEVVQG